MKKLIGLLGAAGLLLPSAAVAGNITNSVGSDALRVTGASTSLTRVSVDSDIISANKVHVHGGNWGHSVDASAENLSYGSRRMNYEYDRNSGQAAGNIAADIEAGGGGSVTTSGSDYYEEDSYGYGGGIIGGDVTHTETVYEGSEAEPGKLCYKSYCAVAPQEETPAVTENNTSGFVAGFGGGASGEESTHTYTNTTSGEGGGYVEGAGTANGTIDGASASSYGHGHEHFVDGAGTVSYDGYANGYIGTLHENGWTHTNIHALTSTSSTERGFSTSSFQDSSWN